MKSFNHKHESHMYSVEEQFSRGLNGNTKKKPNIDSFWICKVLLIVGIQQTTEMATGNSIIHFLWKAFSKLQHWFLFNSLLSKNWVPGNFYPRKLNFNEWMRRPTRLLINEEFTKELQNAIMVTAAIPYFINANHFEMWCILTSELAAQNALDLQAIRYSLGWISPMHSEPSFGSTLFLQKRKRNKTD